jgi:hypothetical protein
MLVDPYSFSAPHYARLRAGFHVWSSIMLGAWLAAAALLTGCSSPSVAPSDVEQATELIKVALDKWQAGETLDSLRESKPPVYVADELWQQGIVLESYELLTPGEPFGTNVRFNVQLVSRDGRSQAAKKRTVKYLVTTTPAFTIAREDR